MKISNNEGTELFINTMEKLSRRMKEDFNGKIFEKDIINKVLNTLKREYEGLFD